MEDTILVFCLFLKSRLGLNVQRYPKAGHFSTETIKHLERLSKVDSVGLGKNNKQAVFLLSPLCQFLANSLAAHSHSAPFHGVTIHGRPTLDADAEMPPYSRAGEPYLLSGGCEEIGWFENAVHLGKDLSHPSRTCPGLPLVLCTWNRLSHQMHAYRPVGRRVYGEKPGDACKMPMSWIHLPRN